MRAGIYARVSTIESENQVAELRRYCQLRGWPLREHVAKGVSGSKNPR